MRNIDTCIRVKIEHNLKLNIIMLVVIFLSSCKAVNNNKTLLLSENSRHFIFEENIGFFEAPHFKSKSIFNIKIGEVITIIKKTENKETFSSIESYWYKIRYKEIEGYVWGGFISTEEIRLDFNKNHEEDFLLSRCLSPYSDVYIDSYGIEYIHNTKIILDDGEILENPENNSFLKSSRFYSYKNQDINILCVNYSFGDGFTNIQENQLYYLRKNKLELICFTKNDFSLEKNIDYKILLDKNKLIVLKKQYIYDVYGEYPEFTQKLRSEEVIEKKEFIFENNVFIKK